MVMINTPKNVGRPTSFAAESTVCRRSFVLSNRPSSVLPQTEAADDVFHHHDSAINDKTEVHCAKAHQISGQFRSHHASDREEERKRNGR